MNDHSHRALIPFHPHVRRWFADHAGIPTAIQEAAWPEIIKSRHLLMTAPTGSGKTLAAFLWAIDRLVSGQWPCGGMRILYISPLKALNNDIRYNLTVPLKGIRRNFEAYGEFFPGVRILTRSGDTPAGDRRKMIRRPPEILITTPESLNLMLSSANSRQIFSGLKAVILDEIHSIAGTRRGTHLITAVDRLVPLCGEFQRIAISATVNPCQTVADFIGGYTMTAPDVYEKRDVVIVRDSSRAAMDIRIIRPAVETGESKKGSIWPDLVSCVKSILATRQSTLIFANSRRITEKIVRLINDGEKTEIAYAHHGSLSKELRLAVENRMKQGRLKAIAATNSLELGIDIGNLDQVILIQTPRSVSSAIQRIGRSGHRVGESSKAVLFPTHGGDYLDAAIISRAAAERDLEPIVPIDAPLDVLAQIILSMTCADSWRIDELFDFIRASYPYRNLSRRHFELTLAMLEGRYAGTRLRELNPRISVDRIDGRITAGKGALFLLSLSGGTIPDRGYFEMKIADSNTKIGELDEEFVWERKAGEIFSLGAGVWRIKRITHQAVEVIPAKNAPDIIPFWKGEIAGRDFHLSEKTGLFLEDADSRIDDPAFKENLCQRYFMTPDAAEELIRFLSRQKALTGAPLPHRRHLLVEQVHHSTLHTNAKQVVMHTMWGGRVNRPFAIALAALWETEFHYPLETHVENDCILLLLPHRFSVSDCLSLMKPESVIPALQTGLERTEFYGARFRENAGRAMLLPKFGFKRRTPLWLNRLRSKKLMESVSRFPDFPITLETWRSCLKDEFDLDHLHMLLDEIAAGDIRITETVTPFPSPFAESLVWRQTNKHMYMDDTPGPSKNGASLSAALIREIALSPPSRPPLSEELLEHLDQKLKRRLPGYAPDSPEALLDWAKERLMIPAPEWEQLLDTCESDGFPARRTLREVLTSRIVFLDPPGAEISSACALESIPEIASALGFPPADPPVRPITGDPSVQANIRKNLDILRTANPPAPAQTSQTEEDTAIDGLCEFLNRLLSFYGPISRDSILMTTGLSPERLDQALSLLSDDRRIVADVFSERDAICDIYNFETLLRMARLSARPRLEPLETGDLSLFLAAFQGVAGPEADPEADPEAALKQALDQLFGFPGPARGWESDFFPARIPSYAPSLLDTLFQTSSLCWFGCGDKKLTFAFEDDLELFLNPSEDTGIDDDIHSLFPDLRGKYGFLDIQRHSNLDGAQIVEKLWKGVWNGRIANDDFRAVRRGLENDFKAAHVWGQGSKGRRTGFNRWKSGRPLSGNWYVLSPGVSGDSDPVEQAELLKDRIRQLFRRYGILFKAIFARELPPMQYSKLFRTLRLMELSGEIYSGRFFKGISGYQFISKEGLETLRRPLPKDAIFWINATDPASLCGLKIEGMEKLPGRIVSAYLVYHGARFVMAVLNNGKTVDFKVPPDTPHILKYLPVFHHLLKRPDSPVKSIMVETINQVSAPESDYSQVLQSFGFTREYRGLELRRTV